MCIDNVVILLLHVLYMLKCVYIYTYLYTLRDSHSLIHTYVHTHRSTYMVIALNSLDGGE